MNNLLRKNAGRYLVALAAGFAAIIVTTSRAFDTEPNGAKATKTAVPLAVNSAPLERDTRLGTSYAPIVKKVAPSVVNVFSEKKVRNPFGSDLRPFFGDPFRWFFGEPEDERPQRRAPRFQRQTSLGSGVIVTKDGYILTNNHVVDGADEIQVSLPDDRKKVTAKVVGRDPKTDIAVLKIDARDLPFATLADSDKIEVGDVVLAIGNPFGIGQTVTVGIISGLGRSNLGIESYEDFIQTDAAINPGNSGGPLVDTEGRVIGINTAIYSRSGGNQGVGFAVPVNMARTVMDSLVKKGRVDRGFLGVGLKDPTSDLAKEFKAPESGGVLVTEVTENSAASEAGLKEGDVIAEFDGKPVRDRQHLRLVVGQTAPGSKVEVKVLRDGKEKTFKVTLKEMPEQQVASSSSQGSDEESDALNGVEVADLSSAARNRYRLPPNLKGALITSVDPDSTSAEWLREGDVIQEIDHKPVRNAQEAVEISKRVKARKVLVKIWRDGGTDFVVVDESKGKEH